MRHSWGLKVGLGMVRVPWDGPMERRFCHPRPMRMEGSPASPPARMQTFRINPAFRVIVLWGTLIWGVALAPCPRLPAAEPRPNFLVIIGEAQGWSSLSAGMDDQIPGSASDLNQTPNLDRIAREGMRFSNFYAPSPRCTPSRAAFFTGKSPARLHMTFISEGKGDAGGGEGTRLIPPRAITELPTTETTLGGLLRESGYVTAHFGKWHLGRTDPARHGYEENTGPTANGGPDNSPNPNPREAFASAGRGADFMARAVKAGRPFYLQVAEYAGRSALDARPETVAAVRARGGGKDLPRLGAAAVAEDADSSYGILLRKLDELGITGSTYVIYTSDHGAPGRNPPLTGGKGSLGEGGVRVPLLVRGPGVRPGSFARQRTLGVDLFPTIAELAGVSTARLHDLEGGSLVPVLRGAGLGLIRRPREEYVIHFPHYDKDPGGPASALYLGDYKLMRFYEGEEFHLYNVVLDPGERHDLALQQPDQLAGLQARLRDYLVAVGAGMPAMNPHPDPSKPASSLPGDRRGGRGGRPGGRGGSGVDRPRLGRGGE